MVVDGRKGVCLWDGRPSHQYARVRWEDGSESDVLPVALVSLAQREPEEARIQRDPGHFEVISVISHLKSSKII